MPFNESLPSIQKPEQNTPLFQKLEHTIYAHNLARELSELAIVNIKQKATSLETHGHYTAEQRAYDEGLIGFFQDYPQAELKYWLGYSVDDEFMMSFLKRFPWFNKRENGKIVGLLSVH